MPVIYFSFRGVMNPRITTIVTWNFSCRVSQLLYSTPLPSPFNPPPVDLSIRNLELISIERSYTWIPSILTGCFHWLLSKEKEGIILEKWAGQNVSSRWRYKL